MELRGLIEYDREMNLDLLDHLLAHDGLSDEYIHKLFSHMLNAQHIWLFRIHGTEPVYDVWQLHDMAGSRDEFEAHYERLFELTDEDNRHISYVNSSGEEFSNSVREIIFHLVNHSNYHRAQINSKLVQLDRPALGTDYINYKRSQKQLD